MSQTTLWQTDQHNFLQSNLHGSEVAELCNALYERELRVLAINESLSIKSLQGRLKSLPYYINRTAHLMTQVKGLRITPLILDIQNASWSAKQTAKLSLTGQAENDVFSWYLSKKLPLGLVVPVLNNQRVVLDCIDRIDIENKRLRTNASGWFSLSESQKNEGGESEQHKTTKLLKPNKRVMLAACAGHCWQVTGDINSTANTIIAKLQPIIPSLRELLLSCAINWKDFKQPLAL